MTSIVPRRLRRLLLQFAAIGLVPVSLMTAWAVWDAVNRQEEQLERSTLEMSRALGTAVESQLNGTLRSLSTAGRSLLVSNGDLLKFHEQMKAEVAARAEWTGVVLTDAQGRVLFKTSAAFGASDPQVVDPESLRVVVQTSQPTIGSLLVGPRGNAAFAVRWPVVADGRLRYVLSAAVRPDEILQVVQKQRVPTDWVVAVFDHAGRRVARSINQQGTLGAPGSPSLVELLARHDKSGTGLTRSVEGVELVTSFTRLDSYGWTVAVGAPVAETHAALLRGLSFYLGGVLISVALCAVLAWRFSSSITRVIDRLSRAALHLGDSTAFRVSRSRIVELDELANALRTASERLSHSKRSMEEALASADESARARDQFLAVLGHELRNPLAPMVNVLHLLDRKADPNTEKERKILRRQVDHMRRLVDDLLDISRVSRGNLQIERKPINLTVVIERALEEVRRPANGNSGISVSLPNEPVWVLGDETRLLQAVCNLLNNAVKFGGSVPVSLRVSCGAAPEVQIEVADKGVGMSPQTLAHIFEPFFQAPQSIARSDGGLGLGLAIVRTVVEAHGGTVTADSEGAGKGSRFRMRLPTIPTPGGEPQAHEAPLVRNGSGRILVVDDNVDVLESLSQVLSAAGYQVVSTEDAMRALTLLSDISFDAAVVDLGMPVLDGYAFARTVIERDKRWRGKLVALSGYGQESDKVRAAEAGFAAHLTKPADPVTLLDVIGRLIESVAGETEST